MTEPSEPMIGGVSWMDLTVEDASAVRTFYQEVVGWTVTDVAMGDYSDYCMNEPQSSKTVAGICHARGTNAGLPAAWLIYITVENLDNSVAKCVELGGEVISEPKGYGGMGRYSVIRDPAGAVAALFEHTRQ